MKVRASAPGRCGILGNPSDIYGGVVLSCSLPLRATCELETAHVAVLPEDPTLWLAATHGRPTPPVRVSWNSEVPRSSGLAGSTALLAATLACVFEIRGETPPPPEDFAELVRDLEYHQAGVVCGYQDAVMATFGGLRLMDFAGKHPAVQGSPPAKKRELAAKLPSVLVSTQVERHSGRVHAPMRDRWLAGEPLVRNTMVRLAELARDGARSLEEGDWQALAEAMTENQALVAELGGSGEMVDALIARCLEGGALAAKLAGAGGGGTVLALTHDPEALGAHLQIHGYRLLCRPEIAPGVRLERADLTAGPTLPKRGEAS